MSTPSAATKYESLTSYGIPRSDSSYGFFSGKAVKLLQCFTSCIPCGSNIEEQIGILHNQSTCTGLNKRNTMVYQDPEGSDTQVITTLTSLSDSLIKLSE